MKYRFVEEALAELIAAGRYYNQQLRGLGDSLVDEVQIGIEVIFSGPTVWRVLEGDIRRYLIRRFPYGIYYSIEDEMIVIWAIKHLHRDPDYWQHRRG